MFRALACFLGLGAATLLPSPGNVSERLRSVGTRIDTICQASGVAGASIGIVRGGALIYTHHFGHSNIERQIETEDKTVYGIGSLTKAFIGATIGQLVHEQKLAGGSFTLDTLVRDVLPEFNHGDALINQTLTMMDILVHRSGLAASGALNLAFQGDGDMLLPKGSLFDIVNHLPTQLPLRQSWSYFVWGYALAGAVIERLTAKPLAQALAERLFVPLGMGETSFHPGSADAFAQPYAALSDGTPFPLPKLQEFEGTFFEASGGIYSSLRDMATWCSAVLAAIRDPPSSRVLKEVPYLVSNLAPIANPSMRERSYGLGWVRTQLPGPVGFIGDNIGLWPLEESPVLGDKDTPLFMLYHQGATVGYYSHLALFPDADAAIVVLTNSMALSDAPDWISRLATQALFQLRDGNDYVALAREANRRAVAKFDHLATGVEQMRKACATIASSPPNTDELVGRYTNAAGLFSIDILSVADESRGGGSALALRFQGLPDQTYALRNLCGSVYEWSLTHDESRRRGRYNEVDPSFYLITFDESAGTLSWTIDSELPGLEGVEVFVKVVPNAGRENGQKSLTSHYGHPVDALQAH